MGGSRMVLDPLFFLPRKGKGTFRRAEPTGETRPARHVRRFRAGRLDAPVLNALAEAGAGPPPPPPAPWLRAESSRLALASRPKAPPAAGALDSVIASRPGAFCPVRPWRPAARCFLSSREAFRLELDSWPMKAPFGSSF